MKVLDELVLRCPVCGSPMSMNLRADDTLGEDEGWHEAVGRYEDFPRHHEELHVLYLGLRRIKTTNLNEYFGRQLNDLSGK